MKLHEIASDQLDEGWRSSLASGALAAAAALSPNKVNAPEAPVMSDKQKAALTQLYNNKGVDQLSQIALAKYGRIDPALAKQVASLALKYQKPTFPRAADILSIVGIESSFRPAAVSGLKKDPARGLMQVRPKVWGLDPTELKNIEDQIRVGSDILHKYYQRFGNIDDAVHAYNIGPMSLKRGKLNQKYVDKFKAERERYNDYSPTYAR